MQAMKELVCTICESITNLNVELTNKRNSSKLMNHNTNHKYQSHNEDNEYVLENDYTKSCQVINDRLPLTLFDMINIKNLNQKKPLHFKMFYLIGTVIK